MLKEGGSTFTTPSYDGQWTKYGVTLTALQEFRKDKSLTSDVIKNLTEDEAREVFDKKYWDPMSCDSWISGKDLLIADFSFNKGLGGCALVVQRTVGFIGKDLDSDFGPKTRTALEKMDFHEFNEKFYVEKIKYYNERPNAAKFIKGWTNRSNDAKAVARALYMESQNFGGDVDFQTADILIAEVKSERADGAGI